MKNLKYSPEIELKSLSSAAMPAAGKNWTKEVADTSIPAIHNFYEEKTIQFEDEFKKAKNDLIEIIDASEAIISGNFKHCYNLRNKNLNLRSIFCHIILSGLAVSDCNERPIMHFKCSDKGRKFELKYYNNAICLEKVYNLIQSYLKTSNLVPCAAYHIGTKRIKIYARLNLECCELIQLDDNNSYLKLIPSVTKNENNLIFAK